MVSACTHSDEIFVSRRSKPDAALVQKRDVGCHNGPEQMSIALKRAQIEFLEIVILRHALYPNGEEYRIQLAILGSSRARVIRQEIARRTTAKQFRRRRHARDIGTHGLSKVVRQRTVSRTGSTG